MVSLIIYGLVAIILSAAVGYAFLTFTTATKQATYTQENAIRLESAVSSLRASLLALNPGANGVVFAPMGAPGSDNMGNQYLQLPASLGAVATSPWGQPYLYCPVSQTQTSGLNAYTVGSTTYSTLTQNVAVESPSGAQYTVTTYSGPSTGNIPYVIANATTNSVANATGYVAFIVSSEGPGKTIPDCSAITVSGASVSVPGGAVRAIAAYYPWNQRVIASTDLMEIYVAGAATGDGTGRDVNNYTTLDAAVNLWQALQPRQTSIYLKANTSATSYSLDSDLDAEDVRSIAQGENTSLLIGTLPGVTALSYITLNNALTLTTATSFINLYMYANTSLTAFKPLLFKNDIFAGNAAGIQLNVIGTSFFAQNTAFRAPAAGDTIALNATNSTVEFYNFSNTTLTYAFPSTQFNGVMSRFSFDSQYATTYNFTGTTGVNPVTQMANPVSLSGSSLNIGVNNTLAINNTNDNIYLNNSTLNVSGAVTLAGSAGNAGIDAVAGSSISIPTGGSVSNSASAAKTAYGIFLRGSKLALDGTLTATKVTTAAIGISEGEFTNTPNNTGATIAISAATIPCIYLINNIQGITTGGNITTQSTTAIASKLAVPVYKTSPTSGAYMGYPAFTAVQLGYQPMVGSTTNPTSTLNSNVSYFLNTGTLINNDPILYTYISGTNYPSVVAGTTIGYIDPFTLERGVRDMVNLEAVTGVSLNYNGGCQ